MNILTLECEVVEEDESVVYDGISFSKSIFILGFLDGINFREFEWFEGSAIVLDQLNQSKIEGGYYLLFTCLCGIADDAGWDPVKVIHNENEIIWEFHHVGFERFVFDKGQYSLEIDRFNESLAAFSGFTVEPKIVVHPE